MNEEEKINDKNKLSTGKGGKLFGILLLVVSVALIGIGGYFSLSNTKEPSPTESKSVSEKSESSETEDSQLNYNFVINAGDLAETITTYDITVADENITVKYTNSITYPEFVDGATPKENGEYTITDSFFIEPLKEVLKKWDEEHGDNQNIDDVCTLLLISLEISQNRNDDLCQIRGSWYCDALAESADYNSDGGISVEENFTYYVHEVDPSISTNNE